MLFDSFMPIHFGAETDLRFVYCAGEKKFSLHMPFFILSPCIALLGACIIKHGWFFQLPYVLC